MCARCYALWYKSVIPLVVGVLAIYTLGAVPLGA